MQEECRARWGIVSVGEADAPRTVPLFLDFPRGLAACTQAGRGGLGGGGFKSAIYGNKNVGNQSLPLPLHEWKKSPDLVGVQTVHCLGKTYLHVPASASYGCKKA